MAVRIAITSRQRWPSYDGDKRSYVKEEKTKDERKKSEWKREHLKDYIMTKT